MQFVRFSFYREKYLAETGLRFHSFSSRSQCSFIIPQLVISGRRLPFQVITFHNWIHDKHEESGPTFPFNPNTTKMNGKQRENAHTDHSIIHMFILIIHVFFFMQIK